MPTIQRQTETFTEHDFERLKPIPNPYNPGMGFDWGDGCCLMLNVDLQRYLREHNPDQDCVWSVVEDDEGCFWLSHGYRWVNVLGYLVTQHPPRFSLTEDIPLE